MTEQTDGGQARDDIGARLRRARTARALSQRDFAAAMDMPLPSYRDYEGGKRVPGGEALQRLARAGLDTHWLLTGEEPATAADRHNPPVVHESHPGYGTRTNARQASFDLVAHRLREVIAAVEACLEELGRPLSPADKAELIVALYEIYAESGRPPSATAVKRLVRAALRQ